MTIHERLMLARHLERAALAYRVDAHHWAATSPHRQDMVEKYDRLASEASSYAALLREGNTLKMGAL